MIKDWNYYSCWGFSELLQEAHRLENITKCDTRSSSCWGESELIYHILQMNAKVKD